MTIPFHSFYRGSMTNMFLSIAMLGGFALLWGAWRLWKREGLGQKVWLMIAAALILFANIAIWTIPDNAGRTLAGEAT